MIAEQGIPQPPASMMAADDNCAGGESFALMVLGTSMEPEFVEGEVIVIEPDGLATDGAYVLALHAEEWTMRQLVKRGDAWTLHALNPAFPDMSIPDLAPIKGIIIQKSKPGRRRASKRYV